MTELDPELLQILVRIRSLGVGAMDKFELLFGKQRDDTIHDIILVGQQPHDNVLNIITFGALPRATVLKMVQRAIDDETAERRRKSRWQIFVKASAVIVFLLTVLGVIPILPSVTAFFTGLLNWFLKRSPQ